MTYCILAIMRLCLQRYFDRFPLSLHVWYGNFTNVYYYYYYYLLQIEYRDL